MSEILTLGDITIELTRKEVKHVHLSVLPPDGQVRMVAPPGVRTEVARAYAVSKLAWIRAQQAAYASQARETPRKFVTRETHYVWGRRHLLEVEHREGKPHVKLDHRKILLVVRPDSDEAARATVMHAWRVFDSCRVLPGQPEPATMSLRGCCE
jgi:hypothetical protein